MRQVNIYYPLLFFSLRNLRVVRLEDPLQILITLRVYLVDFRLHRFQSYFDYVLVVLALVQFPSRLKSHTHTVIICRSGWLTK